jgi:hypothetical protein
MKKVLISLENRNSSGVYALICLITQKYYVGSSVKLGNRLLDYMQPAYLAKRENSPVTTFPNSNSLLKGLPSLIRAVV